MINTEVIVINGAFYIRTWSDRNMMIERDGVLYEEALDPDGLGRTYNETEQEIIYYGDAMEEDYINALAEFGVKA